MCQEGVLCNHIVDLFRWYKCSLLLRVQDTEQKLSEEGGDEVGRVLDAFAKLCDEHERNFLYSYTQALDCFEVHTAVNFLFLLKLLVDKGCFTFASATTLSTAISICPIYHFLVTF